MTEKRFEINNDMNLDGNVETYELSCLVDNENKTFYFVVDSIANVESFVERLNELHEEKEILEVQLKSATNVIDKLGSEIDMLTDTCHDCCKEIREENKELKSLCKVLIKHIDEKSIAFVIDEDIRRLLE